jgi:hypothetical protein
MSDLTTDEIKERSENGMVQAHLMQQQIEAELKKLAGGTQQSALAQLVLLAKSQGMVVVVLLPGA